MRRITETSWRSTTDPSSSSGGKSSREGWRSLRTCAIKCRVSSHPNNENSINHTRTQSQAWMDLNNWNLLDNMDEQAEILECLLKSDQLTSSRWGEDASDSELSYWTRRWTRKWFFAQCWQRITCEFISWRFERRTYSIFKNSRTICWTNNLRPINFTRKRWRWCKFVSFLMQPFMTAAAAGEIVSKKSPWMNNSFRSTFE